MDIHFEIEPEEAPGTEHSIDLSLSTKITVNQLEDETLPEAIRRTVETQIQNDPYALFQHSMLEADLVEESTPLDN